ncbi:hypothetical protein [Burkholderia ubonensis]|uniref:hypothetical protein n=1 Tax=Burkholderia ubonensis TaxID=101571 RepID=UPI0007564344|nr:hypothetical protein [Burkholderia ubonensis]KVW61710.1 hypothetical protein WK98_29340 [Burkholderia ubonensis]
MADILERLLQDHGPILSTELTRLLVDKHKLTPAAARKRVSRLGPDIARLYLAFPRNARFVYLKKDFGSPEYWQSLIKALLDTRSAYGLALVALQQRGGIMLADHFPIACGAPLRQAKHLSPETIVARLKQANLVGEYVIPGVGNCIGLVQGPDRYDFASAEIKARVLTEEILLNAIKMWMRNLGLVSYDKVAMRGDSESLPKVSTFAWDLTAPSYLGPMLDWSRSGTPKQGFVACDVLLGLEIDEPGLRPFIYKSTTLRSLKNVGRCLQIFVASRYTKQAFDLAKRNGIVPATPDSLFGSEVAEGLAQLTTVLREAAVAAANPEVLNEVFSRLSKIEGAANNLRGALFEFVVAEIVRQLFAGTSVTMNEHFQDDAGAKAEVDVVATNHRRSVHFIECKGYQPYGTVPDKYVMAWLEQRLPLVYQAARKHSGWKDLDIHFEFWTTGKLSPAAIAAVEEASGRIRKYTVAFRDASAVRDLAKQTRDTSLIKTLEQHFLAHPMATVEAGAAKRVAREARSLASKESAYPAIGDFPL